MSTLILSLPAHLPTLDAELHYVLSDDGRRATQSGHCSAQLLPAPGRSGETVAVVPVRRLSWQRTTLPQGVLAQAQRLRAALEGLLEEQLLDEPDTLHFAVQPGAAAGTPIWVAACERAWLRAWLALLEASGHRVDRIVPAFAPGPSAADSADGAVQCTLIGTPEEAIAVVTGLDAEQSLHLMPLATLASSLPANAELRTQPAVAQLAERVFDRPIALLAPDDGLLEAAQGPWDLAQGDLASNQRQRVLRGLRNAANAFWRAPGWRAARWAVGLTVLVQIAALNLWAWRDGRAITQQQAAVRSALTQTFPQVKLVVDAPVQMQKEVQLLRQQTGALSTGDLETLLDAAADALPASQVPTRIDYADGVLRLTGLTLTAEERSALQQPLATRQVQSSSEDGVLVLRAAGNAP